MTQGSGGRRAGLALFGGVFVGAMVATAMVWTLRTPTESPVRRFRLFPAGAGLVSGVAISPDGKKVAYSDDGGLWVRDLDRLESREISTARNTNAVFWSPESAWVGYGSGGMLWKVPAGGGEATAMGAFRDHGEVATSGAWTPDGRIVFTTGEGGLLTVSADNGEVAPFLDLLDGEDSYHDVSALPYGRGYLYIIHRSPADGRGAASSPHSLALVSGNTRKLLHEGQANTLAGPTYSPTGHILFQGGPDGTGIWALPFNLTGLEATGEPFLVASGGSLPTVSDDETLVYLTAPSLASGDSRGEIVVVENWLGEGGGGT
jgi:WD40 repeat protein